MLSITSGENEACARIVLAPNNSAGWRGNKRFFHWVAAVSLLVAFASVINGAPLILLFSGLELLALYFALRMVSKRCARLQVIEMTPFEVRIQTGHKRPEKQWRWQRLHTKVEIQEHRRGKLINLINGKQKVNIGDFLTEKELGHLVQRLKQMVNSYQHYYL